MKSATQQSSVTQAATPSIGPVQRHASDSVRGAVRGMSFDEGAAALAPVQRKAVQRNPGVGSVGGSSAAAASSTTSNTPAAAPAQAGGGGGGGGAAGQAPGGAFNVDAPSATINAGSINLNAPMVQASGVLRVGTLVADSVIGSSYSPGAGNVM